MRRVVAVAMAVALGGAPLGGAPAVAHRASPRGAPNHAVAHRASPRGAPNHAVARAKLVRCAKQRLAAGRAVGAPGAPVVAAGRPVPQRLRACGLGHVEPATARRPVAPSGHAPDPPDPSAAPVPADAPVTATATPPGTAPAAQVHSTLGVGAYDRGGFLLLLTRSSVPAGDLTVFFRNDDVSNHNLWIAGPGDVLARISDTVGENDGASRTLAVTAGQ
jgi:hypothetical protein